VAFANLFSYFLSLSIGAKAELEAEKCGNDGRLAGK
jgi:hypothetical protein